MLCARVDVATGLVLSVEDVQSDNWANVNRPSEGWWAVAVHDVAAGWGYQAGHSQQFAPPWTKPQGAHDAYPIDAWVHFEGRLWRSLVDANVWKPGRANWRTGDTNGLDEWFQPTGSTDAYPLEATVEHTAIRWGSEYDANVWEPGVFGWVNLDAKEDPDDTEWSSDSVAYEIGDVVSYTTVQGGGKKRVQSVAWYGCLQSHTSQRGWDPPNVPALWELRA